jgi:hypothetical protein
MVTGTLAHRVVADVASLENRHAASLQVVGREYRLGQIAEDHLMALLVGQDQARQIPHGRCGKLLAQCLVVAEQLIFSGGVRAKVLRQLLCGVRPVPDRGHWIKNSAMCDRSDGARW